MSKGAFKRLVEKSKFVPSREPVVSLVFMFAVSFATVTLGQFPPHDPAFAPERLTQVNRYPLFPRLRAPPTFSRTDSSVSRKSNPFKAARTMDSARASTATNVQAAIRNRPSGDQAPARQSSPLSGRILRPWFSV